MIVKINDVSFQYENQQKTLSGIDLQVQSGECVLLCGESGCGKTTITKLVNGLIPHFVEDGVLSGKTMIDNLNVAETEMYQLAQYVGSVFQNPKSQFFNIDTDSELAFGLENAGVDPLMIRKRIEETIQALHIERLLGRNIFSMSGGEKQTLAFASVYAMNPDIFVLDEPTANLDMEAITLLRQQILQAKQDGRTVVIAEHRLYFLKDLIDRAVFIQNGKIAKVFLAEDLWNLSETERIAMGLRSLQEPVLQILEADSQSTGQDLSIEHLTCAYGKNVIFEDISFAVNAGDVLGIVGKNGTGKTTLSRCLCGLHKEKEGIIRLTGNVLKPKQRQKNCFYVMQDVNHQLFADSVYNECLLSAPYCTEHEIDQVLDAFDLLAFKEHHPMSLSGGQKQRLAVATAVLSNKQILIFDEPTSGLDYRCMLEVSQVINRLKEQRKIMIVISHDFEFLNQICDKVFYMK